jgi:hypothetical protein
VTATDRRRLRYSYLVQDSAAPGGYRERHRTITGPFWHGGRGRLRPGQLIRPGFRANSWGDHQGKSVEVWFTGDVQVAIDTAQACLDEHGRGYLYQVWPEGPFRPAIDSPASFRSATPLTVIARHDPPWDVPRKGRRR